MRLVPKYKKDWSNIAIGENEKYKSSPELMEEEKKFQTAFQPNQSKVIAEKSKILAKLHDEKETITWNRVKLLKIPIIYTKNHLPNNIKTMDTETWSEIGEMMKELMVKIEVNTNCHDFGVEIKTGEEAVKMWKEESELPNNHCYPDSEFLLSIEPRYKKNVWWIKENKYSNKIDSILGGFENDRIALKLNDSEEYTKIWGKKNKNQGRERAFESSPKLIY